MTFCDLLWLIITYHDFCVDVFWCVLMSFGCVLCFFGTFSMRPRSFQSVRNAGAKLSSELRDSGLDVLCNNAGIMGRSAKSGDGQMLFVLTLFLLCSFFIFLLYLLVFQLMASQCTRSSDNFRHRHLLTSCWNLAEDLVMWPLKMVVTFRHLALRCNKNVTG